MEEHVLGSVEDVHLAHPGAEKSKNSLRREKVKWADRAGTRPTGQMPNGLGRRFEPDDDERARRGALSPGGGGCVRGK